MNWLWRCFTENLGLKVLSLILAVGLWAALGRDPITEAVFQIPVEFTSVPGDLEVLPEQTTVQVRARGPSRAVRQTGPGDFSIKVDLTATAEAGERTYPLFPADVEGPSSLEILQIVPAQVRLALEPTLSKEVPIRPRFSGEVGPGYRVKDFHVQPLQVRIAGPRSRVDPIAVALTDPLDLTRLSADKTYVTAAYVPDPLVRLVEAPSVKVVVELESTPSPEVKNKRQ